MCGWWGRGGCGRVTAGRRGAGSWGGGEANGRPLAMGDMENDFYVRLGGRRGAPPMIGISRRASLIRGAAEGLGGSLEGVGGRGGGRLGRGSTSHRDNRPPAYILTFYFPPVPHSLPSPSPISLYPLPHPHHSRPSPRT